MIAYYKVMNEKQILLQNLEKIHTTEKGILRIKKNLNLLDDNVVMYCKNKIQDATCSCSRQGKNWYCKIDDIIITINSSSYTIITAHHVRR